jgi:chromate transport protein ChrA
MFFGFLAFVGVVGALVGLLLAFLSQRYWFARAWRLAARVERAEWRKRFRGALIAVVAAVALVALAGLVRNFRGAISRGSWWIAFFGLWLASSIFSYLFIKVVAAVEWLWRRFRSAPSTEPLVSTASPARSRAGAPAENINESRRHFFQSAGVIAGAIPFVSAAYGFTSERFRYDVREVEIHIANLAPALD